VTLKNSSIPINPHVVKEPYISAKQAYFSVKEPYISAKEPYISQHSSTFINPHTTQAISTYLYVEESRALLRKYTALLRKYTALWWKYRLILQEM